jgi:ABC-type multidrug transport system permease subunit
MEARLELTFTEMIAAVMAANLTTFGFVAACVYAQKNPGFSQPWVVWAGLMLPLLFIVGAFITTGVPSRLTGG